MKALVILLGASAALLALPACERHSARTTLDFLNAHKKHETKHEAAAHDPNPGTSHAPAADAHATDGDKPREPKPFFPVNP